MSEPQPTETRPRPQAGEPYGTVAALLLRARRRALGVSLATGACLLIAGLLGLGLVTSLYLGLVQSDGLGPIPAWVRPVLLAALATGLLALGWFFVLRPARDVGGDDRMAAWLEGRLPEARGLASAVQFQAELAGAGPSSPTAAPRAPAPPASPPTEGAYSRDLAKAHVDRMADRARRLDPRPAVPTGPLKHAALALCAVAAVHLVVGLVFSDTVGRGYRALVSRGGLLPGLTDEMVAGVPELITGDVSLTYYYPEYTGLPPQTVSGTGGDIRALRGTEVEVRTRADRDVERAAMVVGDTVIPLSVAGERDLEGRLLVDEATTYRFRFLDGRGRTAAEGPGHRITVEPDAHPDIEVSVPGHPDDDEIEIREQERLALDYRARDDFGLEEIAIVWRVRGGQEHRTVVRRGGGRDRIEGRWGWDLTTLGLAPGDRVAWFLEATDNDTVSGPKRSTTRTRYLKVFSAAEHHRALMAKVEAHWEGMIDRLGDHLEEPFAPEPGPFEGEEPEAGLIAHRHAEAVATLVEAMAETVSELREDPLSPAALTDALANIQTGLFNTNRRIESAVRLFRSQARARRLVDTHQTRRVEEGRTRLVDDLEKGILYLESLLDKQRLQDLIAMAEEIRDHQRRLQDLIERLRENPDEETRAAISEEIARIKERIHELMERMAELARGIRDEHLNVEAMEQLREQEDMLTSLDDIQRMLEEGDLDEALARLMEMANQLESMVDDWRGQDEDFGGEQYAELQREFMEFVDELERVRRDQDNLLEASESLRDQYREAVEERVEGRLDDLVERLTELARAGREALESIPEDALEQGFGRFDQDSVDSAHHRLGEVAQLLEARDFDEARQMAEQALHHAGNAANSFGEQSRHAERYRHFMGERMAGLKAASENAERARDNSRQIVEALEQLFPDPSEVFDQRQQQQMAEMGQQQQQLRQRARDLEQRMQEIGEQAPLFSPDMQQGLQQAGRHMGEASRQLGQSDARQASGQQRAASDRLGELQQQMQEAMERGGGPGRGMPMPMAGRQGSGQGGMGMSREPVEIPDADQYEAPEQFRRELLEAMREGTPERYQEQVRRYYEELVR
jgi:hypothetical protein